MGSQRVRPDWSGLVYTYIDGVNQLWHRTVETEPFGSHCPFSSAINPTLLYINGVTMRKCSWKQMKTNQEPGLPRWHSGKESASQRRRCKRHRFDPWVRNIPWRPKWQPTPVFLPGEFHGQRSLAGYSSWRCKESDMTEHTHTQSKTEE